MKLQPKDWTGIVIGTWLVLSPWILGFSALNLAFWNSVIIGVIVLLLTLWNTVK